MRSKAPVLPPEIEEKKSVRVIPSRIRSSPGNVAEDAEEAEITAQITIPHEGGWGWVVVFASFWSIFVLDGVVFTFGSVLGDITRELNLQESVVAVLNSISLAMYFTLGPLTSALINRCGFRAIGMTGASLVAWSLLCAYFTTNYFALCILYGVLAGLGFSFINMSAALIVGFYFERLRSLALSIATTGSCVGVMVMFPVNAYLVKVSSWRLVILLQSGMFGIVYFMAMTFKPLLSLTVTVTTDDQPKTVTYLPSVSKNVLKPVSSKVKTDETKTATATEKLFSAVSNINFPTAAAIVDESIMVPSAAGSPQQGTSTATGSAPAASRITLTAHSHRGSISQRQLDQVKSFISKTSVQDKTNRGMEVIVKCEQKPKKKRNCWQRLCHWDEHIPQSRPMYRDDAFFDGKIETLPVYQKSMMDTPAEAKTGLEYQLAVSRAVTTADLQEKRGIFTTAVRRILATMMDPKLLKRRSFLMYSISGFLVYLGFLVPYVFIADRNKANGIDESHCMWFVSVMGLSNVIGRVIIGALACKIDPLKINAFVNIGGGISTMLSGVSYNVYYQYTYCVLFGIFVSSITSLRSIILVQLYGLEKLTNATGMLLLFQGFGCCLSTPAASLLRNLFGYSIAFIFSGIILLLSGVFIIPITYLCKKENLKESNLQNASIPDYIGPKTEVETRTLASKALA